MNIILWLFLWACIDALVIEIAKKGGHSYTQSVEDIYQLKENYKIKIQR